MSSAYPAILMGIPIYAPLRPALNGHQALVCTHMDGNNESGNIHVHIVINSLRKFDVEREPFTERPCDSRAGYKHHLMKDYLIHLKQSVMDMCHREHLHQVDLLTPAEKKITEQEYHARRRGQHNMDKRNKKMISEGITPRKTTLQTRKDFLRTVIEDVTASAHSLEEFQNLLMEKYHVTLKISRGRFSYLLPKEAIHTFPMSILVRCYPPMQSLRTDVNKTMFR